MFSLCVVLGVLALFVVLGLASRAWIGRMSPRIFDDDDDPEAWR